MSPRPKQVNEALDIEAWAVAAPGLESLLAAELKALGFADATASPGGVGFHCDDYGLAKAQLWTRIASRVVVRLASFHATAFSELERSARKVEWGQVIGKGRAVALRVTCRKSKLYHSDAVAQRVAEAIARTVDAVTFAEGVLESGADDADEAEHDLSDAQMIVVRFDHDRCTISADASGALLHRRGYRLAVGRAPLRETLAAAMLAGAKWDPATPLLDPMCGAGTIPIEAAMIARRIAPGLRRGFAAERWPSMGARSFEEARIAARARALPSAPAPILGSDRDAGAIGAAHANAERAGVAADIEFSQRTISEIEPPAGAVAGSGATGLIIANPPYGIRVGEKAPLRDLFARFGQVARDRFPGWRLALLSADKQLDTHVGVRFDERLRTSNGGIAVRLVTSG